MYDYTDQHHVLPSGVSSQHTETLFINTSENNPTAANMLMTMVDTNRTDEIHFVHTKHEHVFMSCVDEQLLKMALRSTCVGI